MALNYDDDFPNDGVVFDVGKNAPLGWSFKLCSDEEEKYVLGEYRFWLRERINDGKNPAAYYFFTILYTSGKVYLRCAAKPNHANIIIEQMNEYEERWEQSS